MLEWSDVNSDTSGTEDGLAPLLWAAANRHEGVAKILLEQRDVNPDKPDGRRRTPLLWASSNSHEGVVKILLERDDVNPSVPNGPAYGNSLGPGLARAYRLCKASA